MRKSKLLTKMGCLTMAAMMFAAQPAMAQAAEVNRETTSLAGISTVVDEYIENNEGGEDQIVEMVNSVVAPTATVSLADGLVIAKVDQYVNVRSMPSTEGEIVGKIYDQAAATLLETVEGVDGDWYHIQSGNVDGYVLSYYFVTGQEAQDFAMNCGNMYMVIEEYGINVRSEANTDCDVVTVLYQNDTATVLDIDDPEFVHVELDDGEEGYISREYVGLYLDCDTALTLEEDEAMWEEIERRAREAEEAAAEAARQEELQAYYGARWAERSTIVDYAYACLGCDYVWGGEGPSGYDCSGLVKCAYAQAGYYLAHSSSVQGASGTIISISSAQPGDLVWMPGHIGIYVGNGQCIHAADYGIGVIQSSVWSVGWSYAVSIIG